MRLWSLHPKYLDSKGLTAVWREALLARKVLMGKTRGYKTHPQLKRFKTHKYPLRAINTYLFYVWKESCQRGFCFNRTKLGRSSTKIRIKISKKDLHDEFMHLKQKLKKRDRQKYAELAALKRPLLHPLFILD